MSDLDPIDPPVDDTPIEEGFVVEDGTGLINSVSYVSVEEADDYIPLRYPDSKWDELEVERKEALLEQATDFLDMLMRWRGNILHQEQALLWPREPFTDANGRVIKGIPKAIKNAQMDFASEAAVGNLTNEYDKLIRENFGNTSDTYAAAVIRGGSFIVRNAIKDFAILRYGVKGTVFVEVERA